MKARPEEGLKNSNSILSELHGSLWTWSLIIKTSLLAECLIKNKEGSKLSKFYKDVLHYLTLSKDLGVSGDYFFFESRVSASKIRLQQWSESYHPDFQRRNALILIVTEEGKTLMIFICQIHLGAFLGKKNPPHGSPYNYSNMQF